MIGAILDIVGALAGNMAADERQDDQQNFNSAQSAEQRAFEERMASTRYQRASWDLQAANMNPMLALSQGPGNAPAGSAASSGIASPVNPQLSTGMTTAAIIDRTEADAEKARAEAERARAEAEEIRGARIPERHQNIELMRQQVGESAVRIERIWQEVQTGKASEQNLIASTNKLKAELPKISAEISNLKAMTVERLTQSGLNEAKAKEIHQRIQANLPSLEAALLGLQAQHSKLGIPMAEQTAGAADSFIGSLGGYLRQLTSGLQGLLVAIPTGRGKK